MCSICNYFICPSQCPNHYDKGIYTCECCGDGICDGESYYKIGDRYFHKDCLIENYCNDDLLLLFGASPRVASRGYGR